MDDMNYPFGSSDGVQTIDKTSSDKSDDNGTSNREVIDKKLRQFFDGKIVRKDLTKHIKEGANVPIYVLEYQRPQVCLTLSLLRWEQIQHFSIVCIAITPAGRFLNSDRSTIQMIMAL